MRYFRRLAVGLCVLVLIATAHTASAATIFLDRPTWNSNVSGVTTFDFNALSNNFYSSLTLGDVTFDVPGYPDSSALWVSTPGSYAPAIDVALVGNHWMTTVRGTFSPFTTAVGADVANLSGNDRISIDVNINGVWSNHVVAYTYPTSFFWGIVASPGESIEAITFTPTTSNWVGIDNFSYGTGGNTVPDAGSSLSLLGIGLAGLRAWRKRQ